ncbi:MAG: hypothetical protein JRN20_23300, partial [Nitrososphaerota archaeon]|nr:hypothetical protein [Nitrososphaerota archaeon]
MFSKNHRKAISAGIAALVVIIVVIAGSVGAYVVLTQSNLSSRTSTPTTVPTFTSTSLTTATSTETSTSSTSSTSSRSPTSTTQVSTISQTFTTTSILTSASTISSTTSSTTTQSCTYSSATSQSANASLTAFVPDLLGNFTSMTMESTEWVNGTVSSNLNSSYFLVGRPQVNGTQGYEVNFTDDIVSSQVTANQTGTIWFLANGTASEVDVGSTKFSGYYAALEGEALILPYNLIFQVGSEFNDTFISQLPSSDYTVLNQSSVMLGSVQANQTVYSFSPSFLDNMSASQSA